MEKTLEARFKILPMIPYRKISIYAREKNQISASETLECTPFKKKSESARESFSLLVKIFKKVPVFFFSTREKNKKKQNCVFTGKKHCPVQPLSPRCV